jgi:hypothetical protein
MGELGGSWVGVFGYDVQKEVRYIFNEYAVLGDKSVVNLYLPVDLYLPHLHIHSSNLISTNIKTHIDSHPFLKPPQSPTSYSRNYCRSIIK